MGMANVWKPPADCRFVLGAHDPEMEVIERWVSWAKLPRVTAQAGGQRVKGRTAYQVTNTEPQSNDVWVECGPAVDDQAQKSRQQSIFRVERCGGIHVDHHHHRDRGFSVPAAALPQSAMGQVFCLFVTRGYIDRSPELSWIFPRFIWDTKKPTKEVPTRREGEEVLYRIDPHNNFTVTVHNEQIWRWMDGCPVLEGMWFYNPKLKVFGIATSEVGGYLFGDTLDYASLAAADHCLLEAYKGEVPFLPRDAFVFWRDFHLSLQEHDRFPVPTQEEMGKLLDDSVREILSAPKVQIAGIDFADLRKRGDGTWRGTVSYAQEAAARCGMPILYELGTPSGWIKRGILTAPKEAVESFLRGEGIATELEDLVGNEARGYASGFRDADR